VHPRKPRRFSVGRNIKELGVTREDVIREIRAVRKEQARRAG